MPPTCGNNLFGLPLAGVSGGPLIENSNRAIAICLQQSQELDPSVLRTIGVATSLGEFRTLLPPHVFQLRNRSRNAPFQQPGQFELAVDSSMIFASNLGFIGAAPRFRLSTPLPAYRNFAAQFGFFTAGRASFGEDTRFTSFTAHLELALGPRLGWLRRSNALGGLYASAGSTVLKTRVRLPGININQTSLSPSWEAGWRYRLPRRSWGFSASYQRIWVRGKEARTEIPGIQGVQAGLFVVLGR